MEKDWWKKSVVYQIYPRSFCDSDGDGIGDLNGITGKLDYLKELGADVIWLSPVYESPNDDNGYDISDYQAVMKDFGTMADFDRMLEEIHARGMKLVMDLVVNHTSDEHPWFQESRKGKDNPYRDYYIWKKPKEGKEPNNWGSCFGGPAWEYEESSGEYYLHLFSVKQPDLNWENPQVRREVYRMMNWWLDKGVDGFRMDVISLISKDPDFPDGPAGITGYAAFNYCANGPRVHEYLQEMRREVLDGRDTITVGECSGVTLEEALKYASCDGKELSMVFQFEHVDLDFDEKGNKWTDRKCRLTELKEVLSRWQTGLYGRAWNSLFWCNHDQPRVVSRFGNDSPEYREVSAKMLAVCLHMMQGTPYIYQGEELGMTNVPFKGIADFRDLDSINAYWELTGKGIFKEEEMLRFLRYKSRDNARTPMQWDASPNAGFTEGEPWIMVNPNYGEINAADQIGRDDSVFSFYKELVKLRKEKPVIVNGECRLLDPESEDVFVYERSFHEEHLLVVCSFAEKELLWRLPEEMAGQAAKRVIGNYEGQQWGPELMLRPYEASVWEWTKGE
ncbi:glycoside hydrolase family 13 protein [Eisenbergiella tayi]|uniref:glycoside hydrolase family 13 protein n=1 Tax=Eisenbergiella tayi TaxID=1432052 RepID=UPI0008487A5B|nr:alpha-glucosidase [Eisenbergiella tayi]ODR43173.1 glucohydrolase [Eisenbergiella tayi]